MAEPETPTPADETASTEDLETTDNSLETPETGAADEIIDATSPQGAAGTPAPAPPPSKGSLKQKLRKFNIYLLLFIFILVLAGGVLAVAYFQSKQASTTATLKTQDLTQSTLQQLAASDASIGSSQQVLNVQSSAVFAGKVLIRDGLEVAANLQVGGTTALTNLTVSGPSQFGQAQVNKNLSVAGDAAVQGSLTAKSIQVAGGGTFSGPISAPQITTTSLQLNGDLVLTHHISAGGPTPGASRGTALGNGGSTSISGSDTAGTVSINVGSSAPAGCFVTVNFTSKYNSVPHVQITPVGSDGGAIDYYINRSTSSFSICDSTVPPTGASFGFDYFVVD